MWNAVKTFFSSGLGFIFASILSFAAGLERESGAWISFGLAVVWGVLGVANFAAHYRERLAKQDPR